MRKRIAVLLMALLMLVMSASPALAAKAAPTKAECLGVQRALQEGDRLTGQQKQLIRQFPNLGQCIAASEG